MMTTRQIKIVNFSALPVILFMCSFSFYPKTACRVPPFRHSAAERTDFAYSFVAKLFLLLFIVALAFRFISTPFMLRCYLAFWFPTKSHRFHTEAFSPLRSSVGRGQTSRAHGGWRRARIRRWSLFNFYGNFDFITRQKSKRKTVAKNNALSFIYLIQSKLIYFRQLTFMPFMSQSSDGFSRYFRRSHRRRYERAEIPKL